MTTTTTASARNGLGAAVVKALNAAITAAMKDFGDRHGCRPMNWYLFEVNGFDRGDVIGFPGPSEGDPADGVRVAQQWATLLGLTEWATETPGYRSWLGLRRHQSGRDLVQDNHSRCGMSSRRRDGQIALFGLTSSTAGRRPAADLSTTAGDPSEATGPDARTPGAAPTAAPNRSGRRGSRVPARASRSDASAPLTRVAPTEQSAPSGAAPTIGGGLNVRDAFLPRTTLPGHLKDSMPAHSPKCSHASVVCGALANLKHWSKFLRGTGTIGLAMPSHPAIALTKGLHTADSATADIPTGRTQWNPGVATVEPTEFGRAAVGADGASTKQDGQGRYDVD